MAKRQFTKEDDALLDELGVETKVTQAVTYTARQERIIAGFEEIQRFVEEYGRLPLHGEGRDIFERLYAVRMDRIRASAECMQLLEAFDSTGLLSGEFAEQSPAERENVTDDELLEALGVDAIPNEDVTRLKHVRPRAEIKAAEEVAHRKPCEDFKQFRPMFEQLQHELDRGERRTAKFQKNAEFNVGDLFIVEGQKVVIADMDNPFVKEFGREDRRLRVIYDNGTESNLMLRSLQRALYRGDAGRRILPADSEVPPLFSWQADDHDSKAGSIYVLRSLSDHPFIAEHRDVIHKIGVTGGNVKRRISNARKDPTFLLADVEIVQTYQLANLNRAKLEKLLHHFFSEARLDLNLKDRFGEKVEPSEWFLVPLPVIQQAIEKLIDGKLDRCRYDPKLARIEIASGKSL